MLAAIRHHAAGRNVIAVLAAIGLLALVSHVLALPAYRAVASGFDPFDMQSPLTRAMVAIQRGAFGPGVEQAYLNFAALDLMSRVLGAVFYILFWVWMTGKSPQPLMPGVLLLFPILALLWDIAEKVGFVILVLGDPHVPFYDVTTRTLVVHRVAIFLREVNWAITLTLAAFTVYFRRRAPAVKKVRE